ncbi:hypothetical protein OSB04_026706, partial [Centaurea solstitialis]
MSHDRCKEKPVITLLESIRLLVMQRMHVMANMVHHFENDVCPAILEKLKLFSRNYRKGFVHVWQLAGIPCVHGVASIISINRKAEEYVSQWLFQASYSTSIKPLNDSKMWLKSPYLKPHPPKERRMPGRPVLKRKKHPSENEENPSKRKHHPSTIADGEGSRSMTCAKKCTNERVDPPVKVTKPRGRPKLNIGVPPTSRGGIGGRGRRGKGRGGMVGVSYQEGEAMIHAIGEGDLRQGTIEEAEQYLEQENDADETVDGQLAHAVFFFRQ